MLATYNQENEQYRIMIAKIREEKGIPEPSAMKRNNSQQSLQYDEEEMNRLEAAKLTLQQKLKEQKIGHNKDIKTWKLNIKA